MKRPRRKLIEAHTLVVNIGGMINYSMYLLDYDKVSNHYKLRADAPELKLDSERLLEFYYPANSKLFGFKEKITPTYKLNPNIGLHPQTIQGHGEDMFNPELDENFKTNGIVYWNHIGGKNSNVGERDSRKNFASTSDSIATWEGLEERENILGNSLVPRKIKGIINRIYYPTTTYDTKQGTNVEYLNTLTYNFNKGYPEIAGFGFHGSMNSRVVLLLEDGNEIDVPYQLVVPTFKPF